MLFIRSETTEKVFEKLREIRPSRIFVAANGPRPGFPEDAEKCAAVRSVIDRVDWKCDVKRNFREVNIGMQPHWHLAISWFFEHVESGIILEDDCVPNQSFFSFSGALLEEYKDNPQIMHINGSNFQFGRKRGDGSYYFSEYPYVWGWATWRRAWQKYDNSLSTFPAFKASGVIDKIATCRKEKEYWIKFFEEIYSGKRDGSDVKWHYSVWANGGLSITPNENMIRNIGFGLDAGHTFLKDRIMDQEPVDIGPIAHPSGPIAPDREADRYTFDTVYSKTFFQKAFYKIVMRAAKMLR